MDLTSRGRYRVLGRPRAADELLLAEVGDAAADDADPGAAGEFDPTYVPAEGYEGDLAETVAELEPGYLVDAALAWRDGTPRFDSVTVVRRTLFEFVDGVTGVFEAARETWQAAEAAGEAMNSRVTRNTDGDPNGALYVFAEQSGARDLFEEFESGVLPLDPLLARVDEADADPGPREVFVMRPADEPFVLVYIAFEKGGMLARTMRDTYDCPR